ncbi:unnamed protein product [Meloidogyne enterolobii]|uniref:Uncharacterized protein n=1 Tax=Meloidogyne enterolobii TaxID=390850 RepID=A0ACB0ZZU0_MELEN
MKFASFLNVLIFNTILLDIIETIPTHKGLVIHAANDKMEKDFTETLNDEAESSVNPQIQKYKETLRLELKNTKKDRNNVKDKKVNRSEYNKEYYQKNKERICENKRNYKKQNKEKINETQRNYYRRNKESINKQKRQYMKIYRQKNKESIMQKQKTYEQNNRKKRNEYKRKYRQNKKNVQSDKNEGTSFVNPQTDDFNNKGKLPIVCEGEGNIFNQEEEQCNTGEDEQNQIEVEEPNKILREESKTNHMDSNKKILPFDLNEKPEDGIEED